MSPKSNDREAAQWVIRQGGRVMINGSEPIRDIASLPPGDFRVTGVDLFGAPVPEIVDAAVLQKPPDDTRHPDVTADAGHSRP